MVLVFPVIHLLIIGQRWYCHWLNKVKSRNPKNFMKAEFIKLTFQVIFLEFKRKSRCKSRNDHVKDYYYYLC